MKTVIASLVSLIAGVAIGWYFGYTRPTAKADRYVYGHLHIVESQAALAAMSSMHAIQCIETGDTQEASKYMSYIVAHYYHDYAIQNRPDSKVQPDLRDQIDDSMRLKLRGRIEQFATTNQILAAQIRPSCTSGKMEAGKFCAKVRLPPRILSKRCRKSGFKVSMFQGCHLQN